MNHDWRRSLLQLPQYGGVSAEAIRIAYWRLNARDGGDAAAFEQIQKAKRELLFEAGLRVPAPRRHRRDAP